MQDKPMVFLAGTESSPETEARYNEWYNGTHIPMIFKSKWVLRVTRYKQSPATQGDYPAYLAIYEFKDRKSYDSWCTAPELLAARDDRLEQWTDEDFITRWRVLYQPLKTWSKTSIRGLPAMFVMGTQPLPELDDKFNSWYNGTHIPMLLKSKHLLGVTRYKLADSVSGKLHPREAKEYPAYLALYEFKDRQSFEAWYSGTEILAARQERKQSWKGGDDDFEAKWKVLYEPIKTWNK